MFFIEKEVCLFNLILSCYYSDQNTDDSVLQW